MYIGVLYNVRNEGHSSVALTLSCSVGHENNDSVFVVADLGNCPSTVTESNLPAIASARITVMAEPFDDVTPQRDVSPSAVKQVRARARPVFVVRLLPNHPSFTIGIVHRHPAEVFAFFEDITDPRKGDVRAGDEIAFRDGFGEGFAPGSHRA